MAWVGLWLSMSVVGCAAQGNQATTTDSGTRAAWSGDADDLDAAVEVGAGQAECVVVRAEDVGEGDQRVRRFELRHVTGRSVILELGSASGDSKVRARCMVQPLGDGPLERLILERVGRRLEDLRGVEWAPIRE